MFVAMSCHHLHLVCVKCVSNPKFIYMQCRITFRLTFHCFIVRSTYNRFHSILQADVVVQLFFHQYSPLDRLKLIFFITTISNNVCSPLTTIIALLHPFLRRFHRFRVPTIRNNQSLWSRSIPIHRMLTLLIRFIQ